MVKYAPAAIYHNHKHQSRDDFEPEIDLKGEGGGALSDDDSDTLVNSSEAGDLGSKQSSKGKLDPKLEKDDDYISESVPITDWIEEQRPRRTLTWRLLFLVVLLVAVILVPVLIIKLQSENGVASGPANSTATTVFIAFGVTTTATATPRATTVITTQTPAPTTIIINPSSSSTSLLSSPTVTIPNEGFHAKSFQNGDLQIFYADGKGNIKSYQRVSGIWSNPVTIAKDAAIGTTVSATVIYYHDPEDDDVDWSIFYVDKNNILQQLFMIIDFDLGDDDYCYSTDATEIYGLSGTAIGYSWTVGTLGSYNYKVGPSLYQSACTYNKSTNEISSSYYQYNDPSSSAQIYIYYDSESGNITKIGYFPTNYSWDIVSDMPLVSGNDKAVECTNRIGGIESVWIATQSGTIEQWWTDTNSTNQTSLWNLGLTYNGSVLPNTSIHGLSTPSLTNVYFQAANNSIMQLSVSGSVTAASIWSVSEVGVGAPGTRLETSGGESATDSFFNLYFQNGTMLV